MAEAPLASDTIYLARIRPWRVGRKLGRTIYVSLDPDEPDNDLLIGIMDIPALAKMVVETHNASLPHV